VKGRITLGVDVWLMNTGLGILAKLEKGNGIREALSRGRTAVLDELTYLGACQES